MLGNLKKENIKIGLVFTYTQLGSKTVNLGECDTIYHRTKPLAKYEIIQYEAIEEYKYKVTARIIKLY